MLRKGKYWKEIFCNPTEMSRKPEQALSWALPNLQSSGTKIQDITWKEFVNFPEYLRKNCKKTVNIRTISQQNILRTSTSHPSCTISARLECRMQFSWNPADSFRKNLRSLKNTPCLGVRLFPRSTLNSTRSRFWPLGKKLLSFTTKNGTGQDTQRGS